MINLKNSKKKRDESTQTIAETSREMYPYGLRITLNRNTIKKLGININNLDIGQKIKIMAKAEIGTISEHKSNRQDDYSQSIELQITDMELNISKKSKFKSYSESKDDIGGVI